MARGGVRQNAGRPFGTTRPKVPTEPRQQQPRQIMWDSRDLEAMMEVLKRQTSRPRTRENSPFRIPDFPKHATPKNGMAQDNALASAMSWGTDGWLAGQVFGGIAGEGLFFPGYAFLAELAQRPEYRLMSEIIATEATRKWIRFKSTGEDDEKGKDGKPKKPNDGPDDGPERDDLAGDRAHSDEEIEAAVNEIMGTKPGASSAGEKSDKPSGDKTQNEKQKKIAELTDFLDNELKVRKWMMEVCLHDGFNGRAHLFLDSGADSAELKTPIGNGRDATSRGKLGKGWLKSIRTIEPIWAYPQGYNAQNPLDRDWYNPQQWYVMGQEIHATRLLKFVAREVPDILKPSYAFGGLSMSQMAQPYIDMWLQTSRSVNQLIHSFSVMVLKTDMATQTQPGGAAQLIARLAIFNQFRDNGATYVVDNKTEDFANVSATLSGLHELQAQAQEHMAFVGRYPLLKFTGIQPSGLNASSEGELRTFYDNVHAYQEWFLRPGVQTVIDIAMITLWGAVDEDIVFEFVPLWGMSEKEEGELRKADAETDQIRIDSGVVSPEEVRKKVIADPASPYQGLDPDDVPDLQQEQEDGLVVGGKKPGEGGAGGGEPGGGKPGGGFPSKKEGGAAEDSAVLPFVGDEAGNFEESDHPRDQGGKFTSGSGGGTGAKTAKGGGWGSTGGKQALHAPQYGLQHGVLTASHGASFAPAPAKRTNMGAPIDPKGMKKVGGQKGSNPGGVYEDASGKRFYVKEGKTKDHVRNELTAAALYDLAGTPTLQYRPSEGGTHIATEMAKLDKDNVKQLDAKERAEARADFMVNAWLANWDAVGLGGDNIGTVNGVPTSLDVGGSLEYRAQGGPKGKAFGSTVGEIDTLRDPKMNPDSAGLYGDMTPAELRASARYVTTLSDDKIRKTVEAMGSPAALADKLIARRDDIATRARMFGAEGDPKKPTSTMVIPVGEAVPLKTLNGVAFKPYQPPADWATVDGQIELDEPELELKGKQAASGVVIREKDGRIWMVQPRGGYGGYEATFPKGRAEEGLSLQANAIKEAYEESGLKVRIVGHLGDHAGDMTMTRYYVAEREGGDPSKHDDESEGIVLVPRDKAPGFVSRKRDRDVIGGIGDDQAIAAMDEFQESKHPRDNDGKFATSSGGGGSAVAQTKGGASGGEGGKFKSKKEHAGHLLTQGVTMPQMLQALGWPSISMPAMAKSLGMKLEKVKEGGITKYKGTPMTAAELQAAKAEAKAKPAESKPEVAKPAAVAAPPPPPPPAKTAAPLFPAPTEGELAKAKKSVPLQLQYLGVPNAPETPAIQALIKIFNDKYAGKELLSQPALIQKVNDFKAVQMAVASIAGEQAKVALAAQQAQQAAQAEAAAKAKAAHAKQAAAQAEAQKAAIAAHAAKNKAVMKELGITEQEAEGFTALAEMIGGSQADVVQKFKKYEDEAKQYGYPITGFQAALIKNYTDGGYASINSALREGSWTVAQHVYVRMVNKALQAMPTFTGTVHRGTHLDAAQMAKYKAGHVVVEEAFTSTSVSNPFSGNVKMTIKAIGKRGAHVKKLSNHKSEDEVVFSARTFFKVTKSEHKSGVLHVEMEEMEHDV